MLDSKLNPTAFILNKWLQSTPGLTLGSVQDGVHLQLKTKDGTKLTSSSIQVSRIVIRSQRPFFTLTPMAIRMDSNSTSAIVVVDLKNADNDAVSIDGLFRVGYMVELKETLKDVILMYRANFEKITQFGSENCDKGPTYAELDCHKHVYQCPDYYFSYDPISKTCTRNDAPRHQ